MGEVAKNIPEDFKYKHPEIEWKKIAGLRDILIHAHFGIDFDIL
ncbi:MAG: HepT-like ribonuclease domain-containing protein [Candidatus Helarchaeota archaeon]